MIRSVPDVFDALGGPDEVAGLIGVTVEAVYNARRRDAIPATWHMRIFTEAQRRSVKIAPELLGMGPVKAKGAA